MLQKWGLAPSQPPANAAKTHFGEVPVPVFEPCPKVSFEAGGSHPNGTRDDQSNVADEPTPHSLRSLHRDSWRGIVRIGLQVVEALQYSHRLRILHNDIKPANLLLDAQGRVWITDFGLAQPLDQDSDLVSGRLAGTLRYMAPERFGGEGDERSDIYSLGITLYELTTLTAPWDEHDPTRLIQLVLESEPTAPSKVNPDVPLDLERILLKAISKEPSERYQSAAELAADLLRFLNGEPVRAAGTNTIDRVVRWGRRWLKCKSPG